MRTKLKKLTSVCLAVIMILGVLTVAPITAGAAEETGESVSETSGDFEYKVLDDDTIIITGYSGSESNLTIPSEIDGYTVTEIDRSAFYGNTSLTSVTIPDTVTSIGSRAFRNCENLTSVIIPDSVTNIRYDAFENTALSSITIPSSVTSIGECAFKSCENLTSVTIPDSVTYIGYEAFVGTALSSITIPSSVRSIGEYAFGYIYNEDSMDYEKADGFTISGYTNSRAYAYAYDNGFTFVSIGEVSPFVYEVYGDDTISITGYNGRESNLTIPSEIDGYTVTEIDRSAFYGNTSLTSVTIPDSVTNIRYNAFKSTALSSITIPSSVTSIGEYAFADCANLKSVTIPPSVTSIGIYAFGYVFDEDVWEYVKADGFTISGYTNSSAYAYAYDNGFTFVSIGELSPFVYELNNDDTISITGYIGRESNLTIPSEIDGHTVMYIHWVAFYDNTSLTSVIIPDTVTSIGQSAFQNCENLTSVTIPDSVTTIGYRAFADTALSSITIPASVQDIGEYAFGYVYDEEVQGYVTVDGFTIYGYTNSEADVYARDKGFEFVSLGEVSPYIYELYDDDTIYIKGYRGKETNLTIPSEIDGYTVTRIDWNAFYGNTSLISVTIPDSVTYIIDDAFRGCTSLESVTIPDSVIYIGWYAFADCTNLKSVTIPASVTTINLYAFGYTGSYSWEVKKIDGFTISGYTDTEAERYAKNHGFKFVSLGTVPIQKLGDVNGDGSVSIDDATAIQKYLANTLDFTGKQAELADVDKNGSITIDDVTLVQKYLAGLAEI